MNPYGNGFVVDLGKLYGMYGQGTVPNQGTTDAALNSAAMTPGAQGLGSQLLDNMGGISAAVGAGASLWNAYNQGKYNKAMLNEQKKYRKMAEQEFNDRRGARQQAQANFNSVW